MKLKTRVIFTDVNAENGQVLFREEERPVNNIERIKRVITKVGDIICTHNLENVTDANSPASELIVYVDRAHALLQIKCVHYRRSFNKIWGYVTPKLLQQSFS